MANISNITLPDNTNYGIRATGIMYGEVDSTSTSTKYTATITGITEYYDGLTVMLKNGVVTSTTNFTININGLGAKYSYNNMATGNDITPTAPTRDTTIFNINYTMLFVYSEDIIDGGAWICYRGYDGNTNTIGYQLRTNSYSLTTLDAFRYYKILFTSANGEHWVPASADSTNNATSARAVNQRPINPFGEIVYCGNNTAYAVNGTPAVAALWQQYTVTLGYSFNRTGAALTLTTKKPVYVKCAPQSDGSAIMDSTTPFVQTLPITDDGKIYILLGMAYSATAIELLMNHPVYYHKDGAIRLWTNAVSIPTKTSDLTNDSGFITTETDPTVPSWAKQSTKPSYTANEVGAVATSAVGAASGVVPLNASSKIDSTYLPSYVDDVIEGYYYNNKFWKEGSHTTEIAGEAGKIYVDLSTDKTYRYSGTAFVEISKGGSVVTVSRDLTSGTKVGVVSVDGTTYQLYAPTPASATQSATTGISIAAHGTGTVTGVQSTTTTASKVTLGTAFSVPNVTSAGSASTWTFEEKSIPNVTSAGSASTWTFEEKSIPNVTAAGSGSYTQGNFSGGAFTQGTDSFTANTPTVINTSKFNGGSYSHSGFNGGSFTRGTFSGGSLTMAMDTTDTKKLNITFTAATHANDSFTAATYGTDSFTAASLQTGFYTAGTAASFTQGEDEFTPATHGADSHTHTAPTIGTAIKVQSKSGGANGSAPTFGTAIKVQSKSGGGNGSAPTLGTAFSIPNVTDVDDVTVPIKNTSASTFVTGTTHTITDNGHTHSI